MPIFQAAQDQDFLSLKIHHKNNTKCFKKYVRDTISNAEYLINPSTVLADFGANHRFP